MLFGGAMLTCNTMRKRNSVVASVGTSTIEQLMASEYDRVVATAQRILGDRGDAEDVAQEIFADCARSHRMHAPGIEAWLCVSAAHRALNLLRGRKRRIARELRA